MRKSRIKWNKYLIAGSIITGFMVLLAVVGAFWTPYSTTTMQAAEKFAAPSLNHLMGTDNFGRAANREYEKEGNPSLLL